MRLPIALAIASTCTVCLAHADAATMAIVRDADLQWHDNPLAPGLRQAVVYDDPSKPDLYVIRVRFAPGAMSSTHFHPEQRYGQVLKGTWSVGAGAR
jgi:quercetin dioxygenase-like cupin family protein